VRLAPHPRKLVRRVLADEIRRGRVEADRIGRVRLVDGALAVDVVAALGRFRA